MTAMLGAHSTGSLVAVLRSPQGQLRTFTNPPTSTSRIAFEVGVGATRRDARAPRARAAVGWALAPVSVLI